MATSGSESGAVNDPATAALSGETGDSAQNGHNPDLGDFVTHEVQHVIVATSSFVTTIVALLAFAFGVVAALAWNKAISDWLTSVKLFNISDPHGEEFADAIIITLIAIVTVTALGIIASRIRGRNLLVIQQSKDAKQDTKK